MKKSFVALFIILLILNSFCLAIDNSYNLNSLELKATINGDGSINVTENWNVKNNGLSKFSRILSVKNLLSGDVKVDIGSGDKSVLKLVSGNDVNKFGEYSISNNNGYINIICGTNRNQDFIYKISYTLSDLITLYDDCADINWTCLDNNLHIKNVDLVSIEMVFPQEIENLEEDVNAWKCINGENYVIDVTDKNSIKLEINDYSEDDNLNIRLLLPNKQFHDIKNTVGHVAKIDIVSEEEKLVESQSVKNAWINLGLFIIQFAVFIYVVYNVLRYIKESGSTFKITPNEKIKYSKELPFEGITPGQAVLIKNTLVSNVGDIFSASLMHMQFKGIIDITLRGDKDNLNNYIIRILDNSPTLVAEEIPVFDFLLECIKEQKRDDMEISFNMLQTYVSQNRKKVSILKKRMKEAIKVCTSYYDEEINKNRFKKVLELIIQIVIILILSMIHDFKYNILSLHTWICILSVLNIINITRIITSSNVLDEAGVNHREKLKALKRFMLEFSTLRNNGVPELELWDYYIIFAQGFGISKKVLNQISARYPNIEATDFNKKFEMCEALNKCKFNIPFALAIYAKE